ncbi:uncharacterized protein N7446_005599 [Penicillium canescens]|uniref:Uncharacterized protein n=1 Tax=Penicillium canescens TaxID=5083 RepID=A0AAD6II13_PENCN|nr:uncharacterized protein N7446_005599 [Penicillium canescens]KAJ6050158.1 hypothetical protein N7444_006874 [Penicillium canescens]KAJ6050972.1 hypothetical protein N7460_001506 [Penicillium canescens]KAJ6061479.1 hypothetical protein N7446_005599 [Penicillium canescens]
MDSPNHELDVQARPPQELLCPPLEQQDLFSIRASDQAAEQWLSPGGILPHDTRFETLDPHFQPLVEEPRQSIQSTSEQAAGALRLYSTLCETYKTKMAESRRLEDENEALRINNIELLEQQRALEYRHAEQEALITYYGQMFDKVRGEMACVIRDWEGPLNQATPEKVDVIDEDASSNT